MSHNTKIEWTHIPGYKGETWNPIIGCSKVSPACTNCYAETMATRLANIQATSYYSNVIKDGKWSGKTHFVERLLNKPLEWKKPRAIFVGSMTDIFHETVDFDWIRKIVETAENCHQHIFIFLTKRPKIMKEFFDWYYAIDSKVVKNIWLGVTAENQEQADQRIHVLLETKSAIRFISVEPMLGKINLDMLIAENSNDRFRTIYSSLRGVKTLWDTKHLMAEENINKLDWVICGGESGKEARPLHPDLVRSLKKQCEEESASFFFKQWGEYIEESQITNDAQYKGQTYSLMTAGELTFWKCGKKLAGKAIDGNQRVEFPRSKK